MYSCIVISSPLLLLVDAKLGATFDLDHHEQQQQQHRRMEEEIVGGTAAAAGEFPSFVHGGGCGGTLIERE